VAPKFIHVRNLRFLLHEVLDLEALTRFPYFADHDRASFDGVLDAAEQMATDLLWPSFKSMDVEQPELVDGRVKVHPMVRTVMQEWGRGGWISAHAPSALGGQQLPGTVLAAARGIFAAANYSASVYPALTAGAAHLIVSFGSAELVERYVPRMFSGDWQGTMALTEPQAGSSLADLRTLAVAAPNGEWRIRGQKIFISCADHDGADNVVNLLLARTEGAPPGLKGISLFVVPKKRRAEDGALVDNDVAIASVFHKLGYRGAPITQLSLGERGDCRGWLVGELHHGLKYMFQMMNEARIDVGMAAAAIASAAYHRALDYARERPQGRRATDRDPSSPPLPIVEHADVKRMLLFQRAIVEGALAVILRCAHYADLERVLEDGEEREQAALLLGLLTPIAKSYPSEMGILAVSQGLQCLGGYGYCAEFPLEQHYRDIRIHAIHEGTTGIQALDLLGRKVVMQGGRPFLLFLGEVGATIERARATSTLAAAADELERAIGELERVTAHLTSFALRGEIELFLADATLYLELFGLVAVGWQWLEQAVVAERARAGHPTPADARFYEGKLVTFRYFFAYELPKVAGLVKRLLTSDGLTVGMASELFDA
jgi:alkylation response protein AidB-like acyl-CoA dehydrogenase